MEDYPRTLMEFEARFSTEEGCRSYWTSLRWPNGFECSRGGHKKAWSAREVLLHCASCGYQCSVTAGTIFQDTHQPLVWWFRAMWWVTSQKNGTSALGLQRVLGLGSYKTAWTGLHQMRRAMVRPGRDRLSGKVEVDETYLGGREAGVRGRQTERTARMVVAVEEDGSGMGRIRMKRITDVSAESLIPFVQEAVEPGSEVHTDGWLGYLPLESKGYIHRVTFLHGHKRSPSELLPRAHRVISLLKRWLMGTHQGAISHDYLDYSLQSPEFKKPRQTFLSARSASS